MFYVIFQQLNNSDYAVGRFYRRSQSETHLAKLQSEYPNGNFRIIEIEAAYIDWVEIVAVKSEK